MTVKDPLWDDFENSDNSEAQLNSMIDDVKRARQGPLIASYLDGYAALPTFFIGIFLTIFLVFAPNIIPGLVTWMAEQISEKQQKTQGAISFHVMQFIAYPLAFLMLMATLYSAFILHRGIKANRALKLQNGV